MTGIPNPPISVDVAVCTFRRPALRQTLLSLFALSVPPGVKVRLIVADNDAAPSARALVEDMRPASPFDIEYVHCPKSNISIARNACLNACAADYLAFIDDDEVALPVWLDELYRSILAAKADAVLGPVEAIYDHAAPAWMRHGDFHSTMPVWVSGAIKTGYTCNVIMDMGSRHISGRRFDLSLGQSGGEDTQFFSAMTDGGGVIAFAPAAVLREPVPSSRASFSWLCK
ncbi:MAG: glycosyltransferase family 2 protein, partial [Pseudorhizobium sp.]